MFSFVESLRIKSYMMQGLRKKGLCCESMVPMAKEEAPVSTTKGLLISGCPKMGAEVKTFFRVWKVCSCSLFHQKHSPIFGQLDDGVSDRVKVTN